MLDSSNTTHEEFYRLHGTLTPARIEALIDEASAALDPGLVTAHIQEGKTGVPDEDFLAELLAGFRDLAKKVRGANRKAFDELIEKLDTLATEQAQSTEFALEELNKALTYLGVAIVKPKEKK